MQNPSNYVSQLNLYPLPPDVHALLHDLDAPPRLVAHLILVHDVATRLVRAIQHEWPQLSIDADAILFGAATHDVGKTTYRAELTGSGHQHERVGPALLKQRGIAASQARFAQTHGQWKNQDNVEDLLVSLADTCWKGKRDHALEQAIAEHIKREVNQDQWTVFLALDTIIEAIAADSDRRLAWQSQFAVD